MATSRAAHFTAFDAVPFKSAPVDLGSSASAEYYPRDARRTHGHNPKKSFRRISGHCIRDATFPLMDPERSSLAQPLTGAQNIDVLIRLGDEHAIRDTAFGVELSA